MVRLRELITLVMTLACVLGMLSIASFGRSLSESRSAPRRRRLLPDNNFLSAAQGVCPAARANAEFGGDVVAVRFLTV